MTRSPHDRIPPRQQGRARELLLLAAISAGCAAMPARAPAQDTSTAAHGHAHAMPGMASDTGFAAMQQRGARVMGVNQDSSHHRFVDLPDGGRIELQRDVPDAAGAARIRAHMHDIAAMFAAGDFRDPMLVHGERVPGTAVMTARRAAITYMPFDLPRGGGLRITTHDPAALAAVHEFLAYQRRAHHAPGASP